jgi:hypothetical protein
MGAALALVGASLIGGIANLYLAQSLLGLPRRELFEALWRPVTAAASMAAFLGCFRQVMPHPETGGEQAVLLLACAVLGAALYLTVLFSLWAAGRYPRGAEATIWNFIQTRILPRLPRPWPFGLGHKPPASL